MLDSKLLKENPQVIEDMLKKRGLDFPINDLIALDKKRRQLIMKMQDLKHKKNIIAHLISNKKKEKKNSIDDEINQMKEIGNKILQLEVEQARVESNFMYLMLSIPNIIHESVPIGNNQTENVIVKQYKSSREKINFRPKDHIDVATSL